MFISNGKDRLVLIFPTLGIVVKVAKVRIIRLLQVGFTSKIYWSSDLSVWSLGGWKKLLFKGIAVNWNEFTFYRRKHILFLQPTYFSFFGFFNIQKFGKPLSLSEEVFKKFLLKSFSFVELQYTVRDGHHFTNPANFCVTSGRVRVLDYGSPNTRRWIEILGEKFYEKFDPDKLPAE